VRALTYSEFFSAVDPLVGSKDTENPVLTVFGVPYDGTTSYRPGTRFGPNAVRNAFLNIEAYSKPLDVDVEKLPLRDLGNLARFVDPKETTRMVSKLTGELFNNQQRFCMLGGEHSITFGSYPNAPKECALVVFDAHLDLRDEWEGSAFSHACFLRRVLENRNPGLIAHIGGRAATKDEWSLSKRFGLVIGAQDAESSGSQRLFRKFLERYKRVYVTIDIDALDPAFAPGTGTPEPGGISTATLLKYLYDLGGTELLAFDIVEVSPPYDNGATATAAARFMNELTAVIAKQRK
jgi:agmatinase